MNENAALWVACVVVFLAMPVGRFGFHEPRPVMKPPFTYLWGVGWIVAGMVIVQLLAGKTPLDDIAAWKVYDLMGAAGIATVLGYLVDLIYGLDGELHRTRRAAGDANE